MNIHRLPRPARHDRAGFSLAELMVVIVILGLLATLVVPNVVSYLFRATSEVVKIDINNLDSAITNYRVNNGGKLPSSLEELVTPDANGNTYLNAKAVPKDPWKNEYRYETDGRTYRIFSLGKDGMEGGEGDDADIDQDMVKERK